jgi:hypothetical protein
MAIFSLQDIRELCGAIHLHTTFSDGGTDFPTLINTANEVGLDFIAVTDHRTLKGRQAGFEGFAGKLLVIVGYEHNDINNINHYLAFNTTKVIDVNDNPQKYIDEIKKDGGTGFLAHPAEKRNYFKAYPPYPWTAWESTGFDGIELWNQMSDWLEHLKSRINFFHLFYPRRFLSGVDNELLVKWDNLNSRSFISGIGGVDAHTMKTRIGPFGLVVFPIKVELKGIRTHLFIEEAFPVDNPKHANDIVIEGLKNGRGFISNYRWGDARGARIFVEYADGNIGLPGPQNAGRSLPACIHVSLPEKAEIRLIRNSCLFGRKNGFSADFDISETGLYRVEIRKRRKAWIYSNPFPIGAYPLWTNAS